MHSELGKEVSSEESMTLERMPRTYAYQLEATARWPPDPGPKPLHQLIKILKKKEYEITICQGIHT